MGFIWLCMSEGQGCYLFCEGFSCHGGEYLEIFTSRKLEKSSAREATLVEQLRYIWKSSGRQVSGRFVCKQIRISREDYNIKRHTLEVANSAHAPVTFDHQWVIQTINLRASVTINGISNAVVRCTLANLKNNPPFATFHKCCFSSSKFTKQTEIWIFVALTHPAEINITSRAFKIVKIISTRSSLKRKQKKYKKRRVQVHPENV